MSYKVEAVPGVIAKRLYLYFPNNPFFKFYLPIPLQKGSFPNNPSKIIALKIKGVFLKMNIINKEIFRSVRSIKK